MFFFFIFIIIIIFRVQRQKGGFKMTKKLVYLLVGFVLMAFIFSFATSVPLYAQEEEEEEESEDIEDFSLEELLDVEITTAGKQAEKIGEIPASVVLVTREDIETYGYQSLTEVLQNIPGLYLVDDYAYENVGIRGFLSETENKNVVFLVNGIPQVNDVSAGFPIPRIAVPVEAIDRIEVVRGPMSVIYGTGAFFGVINIITNQVDEENPANMVSASIGSEKTKKVFVRAAGKSGDFQYSFNGSFHDSYGIDAPIADMGFPAGDVTTDGKLEDEGKFFNLSGSYREFTFNLSHVETQKELMFALPSLGEGTSTFGTSTRVAFEYKNEISEKFSLNAKAAYFHNRKKFVFDLPFPGFYGNQAEGSNAFKAELDLFFKPSPKFNATVGVSYYRVLNVINDVDIPLFNLAKREEHLADGEAIVTQSIFAQFNYTISEKFKIIAGARFEQMSEYTMERIANAGLGGFVSPYSGLTLAEQTYQGTYDQTKAEFIPRIAAIYTINENHIVKFLYGKAINRPSFFQNRDLFDPARTPLEPETIQTLELSYTGYLSPKLSVNLNIFRNMLDKLIYRSIFLIAGEYLTYNANVGKMNTNGIEVTIQAKPAENFKFELSGTYQDTTDERYTDIDIGYSPKLLGYIKASYFVNNDISLAVTGTYVDKMQAYWDDTIDPAAYLGNEVDSYFLMGANLRVRNMFGTGFYLNLRGSNLFDEEIRFPTTANNTWATAGTIGRGLSFLLTLGWKF